MTFKFVFVLFLVPISSFEYHGLLLEIYLQKELLKCLLYIFINMKKIEVLCCSTYFHHFIHNVQLTFKPKAHE